RACCGRTVVRRYCLPTPLAGRRIPSRLPVESYRRLQAGKQIVDRPLRERRSEPLAEDFDAENLHEIGAAEEQPLEAATLGSMRGERIAPLLPAAARVHRP